MRSHRSSIATRSISTLRGFSRATTKRAPAAPEPTISIARSTQEQYYAFVDALLAGEKIVFRDFEKDTPYFDGCLPVEVMAERGRETLRHGPMKPFGLTDAHRPGVKPYAVVQLRQDNKLGTLFNMVGFQTKLKHAEQVRIFRTIPGLAQAEFARLGGLHRNTFLNSPKLLDETLRLKSIRGCALPDRSQAVKATWNRRRSVCLRAALPQPSASENGRQCRPPTTAHGALIGHITGGHIETIDSGARSFQPMNVNFGLFPPLGSRTARGAQKPALCARALADLDAWIGATVSDAAE